MQVIRLVKPGTVDKVIAFDSLPEDILHEVKSKKAKVDTLSPKETKMGRDWDNFSPIQYVLHYKSINNDKQVWETIVNYVNQNVEQGFRIRDLVDMAVPLAPDSYSQMTLEPEGVPIIPLVKEIIKPVPVAAPRIEELAVAPKATKSTSVEKSKHADTCKSRGYGGRLTDGCPRCEQLKEKGLGKVAVPA